MAYAAPPELLGTGQGLYGATASLMTGIAALGIYSSKVEGLESNVNGSALLGLRYGF